jgi:Heterokaryon incompatibility protein (HET)
MTITRTAPVVCGDCGLEPFLYKDVPLDIKGFSIRLVRLHPARDTSADIVVELVRNNDPKVSFDALSWCWGRGQWSKSVRARTLTGDRCLKVSENLESALRHLRYPDKFRDMWIDFLSIDQSSPMEKSRQVPQMAKIYGQANRVCIWLGEHDEKSKLAMLFIKNHLVNLQRFDQLCKSEQYQNDWLSLIEFFERPWVCQPMSGIANSAVFATLGYTRDCPGKS